MNYKQFIKHYAKRTGRTNVESEVICSEMLDTIMDLVIGGEKLSIYGVGTFESFMTSPRFFHNVHGGSMMSKSKKSIRFQISKALKNKLNPVEDDDVDEQET